MPFEVIQTRLPHPVALDATLWELQQVENGVRVAQAVLWPALGFNCLRWQVGERDLLFGPTAESFADLRPTRFGVPVLFPFPNRIRAGRFHVAGQEYQLPCGDSTRKNAIHGFACRHPWRVIDQGSDERSAWVTGEFHCAKDGPADLALWPADHRIRLTYRLSRGALRLEAEVHNPDSRPLPFGLGYHPYFAMGPGDLTVEVPAQDYWVLEESLPTGECRHVDDIRDLNVARPCSALHLDDVLTELPPRAPRMDGLIERALLRRDDGLTMRLFCSPEFRELVVFTPPHRQAFCVEPYTCPTDAIHLQEQIGDVGWKTLAPGASWTGTIEFWV
ncbi:MAG: aldose 1-epimerase [Gemmataceae bacterium]